jgi:signal transduction histidine kinase
MAHEIRNPLGSIRGTAEILQEGIDPADRRYEFTCILIKEVDRLNKVVQNFLDFARPSGGDRELVDINRLLDEVLTLTGQPALKNGVTTRLEAGVVPEMEGDGEQLKQAFLNLVLNALQAMPSGGSLTISTALTAGTLEIRFTDTGGGIPRENLDRIFNPFFTTRGEGTGLGLAITHRIIQGHGGRIAVESRLGAGTTFVLTFPANAP